MNLPILYVKDGCPWCVEAINFFEEIGLQYEMVDVRKNPERMTELVGCSGQNKTPTLKSEEFVVADFDTDEFKIAMKNNPMEAKKIGFSL